MIIVENYSGNYADDIVTHFGLNTLHDGVDDTTIFNGIACVTDDRLKDKYKRNKNKVYINTEAPCSFLNANYNSIQQQQYFDKVLSICPYTNKWLNSLNIGTKFIDIPFPYNHHLFEKYDFESEKEFDVIYYGQVHSSEYYGMINAIINFNYKYVTLSNHGLTPDLRSKVTEFNIPTSTKWDILNKTKICVGMNKLFINDEHKRGIRQYPKWGENEAFKLIERNVLPQFKTRPIESALCKTLMLIKRDEWNVIENWFTPEKDFIYWVDENDLREKIYEIINHYDDYKKIINNANQKVKNFSINKIISRLE